MNVSRLQMENGNVKCEIFERGEYDQLSGIQNMNPMATEIPRFISYFMLSV